MEAFAYLKKVDKHDFKKVLSIKPVEEATEEEIQEFREYHRKCMIAHGYIPRSKQVVISD